MQNYPSKGLKNVTTITENPRVRKLLFAGALLCALFVAVSLPAVHSLVCARFAQNWSEGWGAWKDGDAATALCCWSRDSWLADFAPRPARLLYWRARALEELGRGSESDALRLFAAQKYPFDYYTFLIFKDGGASVCNGRVAIKTARLFSPRPWSSEVARAAVKTGVSEMMIWALMKQESKFRADAVSKIGAVGLMQLMPDTAEEEARELCIGKPDLYDPTLNILLGARHFAVLKRRFTGELPRAVAAYNAGAGSVRRWNTLTARDWAEWVEDIPYAETREFVRSVLENAETYRLAYGETKEMPLFQAACERPFPIPMTAFKHNKTTE